MHIRSLVFIRACAATRFSLPHSPTTRRAEAGTMHPGMHAYAFIRFPIR